MSQQLIINAESFGGVFSRKGEKSVRVDDPFSGTRWIPVYGREVVVARQRFCSERYVPAECLPEDFLATLKEWQIWRGQVGDRKFVWKSDLPASGVRLVKDWHSYECDGPSTHRFTVPAGTLVIAGDSGNAAQAGYHWEVAA